jgi:hypothetical protein
MAPAIVGGWGAWNGWSGGLAHPFAARLFQETEKPDGGFDFDMLGTSLNVVAVPSLPNYCGWRYGHRSLPPMFLNLVGDNSRQKMNEQSDHYDPDERTRHRDDHNLTQAVMLLPANRVKSSHSMFLYSRNA